MVNARRDNRFKMAERRLYESPSDPIGITRIASDGISGDGYKRSMWHNQPLLSEFKNNKQFPFGSFYDVDTTNVWDVDASGSGTALVPVAGRGAFAKFTNGASDNNYYAYNNKYAHFGLIAGKDTLCTAEIIVKTVAKADIYFGLCAKILSGNMFDNRVNGIGFYTLADTDGNGLLRIESTKASTPTQVSAGVSMANGVKVKLGFNAVGLYKVCFYVDEIYRGIITTNIPTVDLNVCFGCRNGEAAANEFSINTINVAMER